MPMRIPSVEIRAVLLGDSEWQSEWGITYVCDRIKSYGNVFRVIYGLGDSVATTSAEKYSKLNNIEYTQIKNSNNWLETILSMDGLTHILLFSNQAHSDPFVSTIANIGYSNKLMVCRAIDYISHFCFEIPGEIEKLIDMPYFYNNKGE